MPLSMPEITTKQIVLAVVVLLGGGGMAAADMVFCEDPKAMDFVTSEQMEKALDDRISTVDNNIDDLKKSVTTIQVTLNKQAAREAALKAVEGVKNKNESLSLYNQMYDRNMQRLARGEEPCYTLKCN